MAAKILIVDDEPTIAKIDAHYLKKNGFDVLIATNGTHAVRTAFRELPDLILLDLMMPEIDGLTALRILKRNPKTKGIPVIIVSAKGQQADVTKAIDAGAVDYVVKPFHERTLVEKVKGALRSVSEHRGDDDVSPTTRGTPLPPKGRATVLVVEDDHFMGRLMKYRLEQQNYRVILAKDGAQALDAARTNRPDLVLLDIMIPGMNGYQVCEALRADPATQPIPILIASALSGEEGRAKALSLGADDYMVKPFRMDELISRIQALLEKSSDDSKG